MKTYRIASIPGDGIGQEVIPAGIKIGHVVSRKFGFRLEFTEFPWSCENYVETGSMMPDDGLQQLKLFDSIYLGAVGWPTVSDHISLWGLLIPIRRAFDQYANVRPVRLLKGMTSPLANKEPKDINFIIVRENCEGEYSEIGGRIYAGTDRETVIQQSIFTRYGTDRILRFAFQLAKARSGRLTSATKSNGIMHSMPFWDERLKIIQTDYPDILVEEFHIDILTAHFVQHPEWFDVVVGSNLFGDILSDLGPAIAGSIGIAPSANINPERKFPSMFEPVHGSAPDIAGKNIANPIAAIWTMALMLDHLGEAEAAKNIETAIESVLAGGNQMKTNDLQGNATTSMCTNAIIDVIRK